MKRLLALLFLLNIIALPLFAEGESPAKIDSNLFHKHTIGLNLGVNHSFAYYPANSWVGSSWTGDNGKLSGTGFAMGVEYKRTFNKYFALFLNLGYDYVGSTEREGPDASKGVGAVDVSGSLPGDSKNAFYINAIFAFQWDLEKEKEGFVPYVGVGPNMLFGGPVGFAPGLAIHAGLRYNFTFGLYVGIGFEYVYSGTFETLFSHNTGYAPNMHTVRGKISAGYRF